MLQLLGVLVFSMVMAACGDSPLESVGQRSSGWINEPVVTTTAAVVVTGPVSVGVQTLSWSNDEIVTQSMHFRKF